MEKPFEINLTESQVDFITKLEAGPLKIKSYRITIFPDQIVKELSNREKWDAVFKKWYYQGNRTVDGMPRELDKIGINADAAYRAVVGEE